MNYILDDDAGIKKIGRVYDALKEGLVAHSEIVLDFANVGRVDLSLAQAVMAAGIEAKSSGLSIRLKNVSDEARKQFQLAGLIK